MAERKRSQVAVAGLVGLGVAGALLALALFMPVQCGNTDAGWVMGPDPNDYQCSTLLIRDQDALEGPTPGTDRSHTGSEVLQSRMMLRALAFAAVPLGAAVGGFWWLRRGDSLIKGPRSKAAAIIYVMSAAAAAAASLQAAYGVLDNGAVLAPLLIPIVVPLVRFLAGPDRIWVGWPALAVQIVLVVPLALPIGLLYAPSALLLLVAVAVEGVHRLRTRTSVPGIPSYS